MLLNFFIIFVLVISAFIMHTAALILTKTIVLESQGQIFPTVEVTAVIDALEMFNLQGTYTLRKP